MRDRAAVSLLIGAGRASSRFVFEVAVSFVATLCVTLVLSGWFRPGTASVASPEVAPASSTSPVIASSPATNDPARVVAVSASAPDVSANLPLLVEKDVAEKDRSAAMRAPDPASLVPVPLPRPRPNPHLAKATSHNAQGSCTPPCPGHSNSEAVARTANLEPPMRQVGSDPLVVVPPAATAEGDHRPTVFGVALPTVPVHAVLTHPLRPVLQGASSMTELLTGIAVKP